jgi:alcohol dehydrogenase
VKAGDKVLIMGASGGVGTCCVQLAKMVGVEVVVCTSSAVKGEKLRAMGAYHVVDTSVESYVEVVWVLWGRPRVFGDGGGVDVIVNYNGGDS